MKKLICDRCGAEITEKEDIELMLDGSEAWETAVRASGAEVRGLFPCQHFIRCGGEMIIPVQPKKSFLRRRVD